MRGLPSLFWRVAGRSSVWIAAGALIGLSGCLDFALVSSIAFPPTIPGLDPQQPWVALPVGSWVTEGRVEAQAIAGCFDCAPAAAIGLFRASGPSGAQLLRMASHPDMVAALVRRAPAGRPGTGAKPPPEVVTDAVPLREGGWTGFVLRIARQDGAKAAAGIGLVRPSRGGVSILIVVAATDEAARRLARDVVAHQS